MQVVDASVAFKWFIAETTSDQALALLDGDGRLQAPDVIFAEVANAMWVRLRGVDGSQANAVLQAVEGLGRILDRTVPVPLLLPRAVELAFRLTHPVYDCLYLALAERDQSKVVTADKRLVDVARKDGFDHLVEQLA
jgi:predicted nucleic acid-binding protein